MPNLNKKISISKIFVILILILPITSIYAIPIPIISFGEFLMIGFSIFSLLNKKQRLLKTSFYYYLFYAISISFIITLLLYSKNNNFKYIDMFERIIRDMFYFFIIFYLGNNYFNFKYACKIIKKISIISSLFIIFQFITYISVRIYVPGMVPILKTRISNNSYAFEIIERYKKTAQIDGYAKGTGFFSEPAVCSQYLIVPLLLELFTVKKVNYKLALLYSLGLIFSGSVNSYVVLAIAWGLHFFYNFKISKKNIKEVFWGLIILLFLLFFMKNTIYDVITKLISLKNIERYNSSASIRVLRGINFYLKMPLSYQIFGIGFGNFIEFKKMYNIITKFEVADEYMNTISYILVSSGIIGLVLYIFTLLKIASKKIMFSKMLFIILTVLSLSSSLYSTPQFCIILLFLIYSPKKIKNLRIILKN